MTNNPFKHTFSIIAHLVAMDAILDIRCYDRHIGSSFNFLSSMNNFEQQVGGPWDEAG